jgi:hypothetical protein
MIRRSCRPVTFESRGQTVPRNVFGCAKDDMLIVGDAAVFTDTAAASGGR